MLLVAKINAHSEIFNLVEIFILDLQTMQVIDLSGNKPAGTNDLQPRFFPDGPKIIFVNTSNVLNSLKSVMVMDVNGSKRSLLFNNLEKPQWK